MAVVLFMNFTAYSPYSQNNIKILKTGSQAIPTVNNSPRKTLLRTSKPKQEKITISVLHSSYRKEIC